MTRLRRFPPSGPRHTDLRRRVFAAAATVMLLTVHALAVLHFVFVPHTIDARTNTVVRCNHARGHASGNAPSRCPDNGAPERDEPSPEECRVHALLQQAQILTPSAATVQTSITIETVVAPAPDTAVYCRIRVYLVSPAHSPPLSALV